MYSTIFHPAALTEYMDASLRYEQQLPGLSLRFEAAIEDKLNKLLDNPFAHPIKKAQFRQAVVDHFPFLVVYKVDESRGIIYISAIFHMRRNPKKKYRKF